MMDLKEIIKWFIPCFHILLVRSNFSKMFVLCLFLFFNLSLTSGAEVNSENASLSRIKSVINSSINFEDNKNSSVVFDEKKLNVEEPSWTSRDTAIGRTFGRPFKKMMAGLLPIIFQIGAASTWAVVAALVGLKTLLVAMVILKVLLIAGAAKVGALFGSKQQHHGSWQPPQKEIHLHIHNGGAHEHHEEHLPVSSWSRDSYGTHDPHISYVYDPPYRAGPISGPQTISTPFGNYVKIDSAGTTGNAITNS